MLGCFQPVYSYVKLQLAGAILAPGKRTVSSVYCERKEMAAKIRHAAKALNYQPNQVAKSLRSGKSYTIGFKIIPVLKAPLNKHHERF